MSGRPRYLESAIERIGALGEKAILAFMNQIPRESFKHVAKIFPSLPGFRPGQPGTVQKQTQSFAHKIATYKSPKSSLDPREKIVLYGLWYEWSISQFNETSLVVDFLKQLSKKNREVSIDEDHSRMTSALTELVASGVYARETLEQFVNFSPFESVDDLLNIAKGAPLNSDLKRDSTLLEFREEIKKNKDRSLVLEKKLNILNKNSEESRSNIEEILRTVDRLEASNSSERAIVAELKETMLTLRDERRLTESQIKESSKVVDRLSGRVSENERRSTQIAHSIEAILGDMRLLTEQLKNVSSDHMNIHKLEEYLEKIASQDRVDTVPIELSSKATLAENGVLVEGGRMVALERLQFGLELPSKSISTPLEVLSSIQSALVETGLKKTISSIFAEELLAALITEQIVFLRGGMAVEVARKCAASICGASVFRIAMPSGLIDPADFRNRLNHKSESSSGMLRAIIIEGINNSPLDVVREALIDQVSSRVGNAENGGSTLIFASLVDGAGAFPLEASYLELGPVFDLEQMDWRYLARSKSSSLASIPSDAWPSFANAWESVKLDHEELLGIARRLSPRRSIRMEANLIRASAALHSLRRDKKGLTVLQSAVFGWLAPYWIASAVDPNDIDLETAEGMCDGTVADERLKKLATEYHRYRVGSVQ